MPHRLHLHVVVVIIIRNVRYVRDVRVRNVHVLEILPASVVRRIVRLSPAQRAPAKPDATAKPVPAPARTAKPNHQRWRIVRTRIVRTRHPTPISARVSPTAVVERSKSPGRIILPRPSPRLHPDPVPIVIRRPACRYVTRNPDVSVLRIIPPRSIFIQIFVTHSSRAHIPRRIRMIKAFVPCPAPIIETIATRSFIHHMLQRGPARKPHLLPRLHLHASAASRSDTFTTPYRHHSCSPVRIHIEAVIARLQNRKCLVRRVNFVNLSTKQPPHVNIQRALMQLQLHRLVRHVGQRQTRLRSQPQHRAPQTQFRARILIRPNIIRGRQRTIQRSQRPLLGPTRLHGHRSRHILQARHPPRRIRTRSIIVFQRPSRRLRHARIRRQGSALRRRNLFLPLVGLRHRHRRCHRPHHYEDACPKRAFERLHNVSP